ncbi:hypothetical protein L6260_02570 [Candidatus Parcubacteria bacterium]|nr:hypothetical protein [Patescibacteria group bacterium]MCG2687664.1 hypothetical protein [Candidatus Parcubacteria bacterium]
MTVRSASAIGMSVAGDSLGAVLMDVSSVSELGGLRSRRESRSGECGFGPRQDSNIGNQFGQG